MIDSHSLLGAAVSLEY